MPSHPPSDIAPVARRARPTCPACGFAVFNRRYRKCEKCGVELPPSIAYSPAEIDVLRAGEEQEAAKRARRAAVRAQPRPRLPGFAGADSTKDSIVPDVIELGLDLLSDLD